MNLEISSQFISQLSKDFFNTSASAQTASQREPLSENIDFSAESEMDKSGEESIDESVVESNGNIGGDDETYEVDRILQTRMQGKVRMFLVRWKNYGPDADSWEPFEMLKEGAEESVKEFMEEYEKNKAAKKKSKKSSNSTSNTRKRGRSTRNSSIHEEIQSINKVNVETDKEPTSEEDDWSDGDEASIKKKTKRKKSKTDKSVENSSKSVSPSKSMNLNKTPWFMDTSSDSDSESPNKSSEFIRKSTETASPESLPLPSIEIELPSSSKSANGIVPKIKIIQSPTPVLSDPRPDESVSDLAKIDEKKPKKEKNNKKHKSRLVFEGIFRKSNREPLNFIAKNVENGESTILTQDEAIVADSRSLAKFLIGKITFDVNGSFTVNGGTNMPLNHR